MAHMILLLYGFMYMWSDVLRNEYQQNSGQGKLQNHQGFLVGLVWKPTHVRIVNVIIMHTP